MRRERIGQRRKCPLGGLRREYQRRYRKENGEEIKTREAAFPPRREKKTSRDVQATDPKVAAKKEASEPQRQARRSCGKPSRELTTTGYAQRRSTPSGEGQVPEASQSCQAEASITPFPRCLISGHPQGYCRPGKSRGGPLRLHNINWAEPTSNSSARVSSWLRVNIDSSSDLL